MKSNVFKSKGIRQRSPRNTNTTVTQGSGAYSDTDHKVDAVHQIVRDQLAPRIAQKSANATLSDRREFFYYKRKQNGRRCSCFKLESNPDSDCRICYGTGYVGGFDKFGTQQEILDSTLPYVVAINVRLDFDNVTGFIGRTGGYVEAEINIPRNARKVDAYFLGVDNPANFQVLVNGVEVKSASDLEQFLGSGSLRVRVVFLKDESYFMFLMVRFAVREDLIVSADISNNNRAPSLDMFGEIEALDQIPMVFAGPNMYIVNNKDLLYRLSDGAKLKIIRYEPVIVANVLTSVNAEARYLVSTDRVEKNLII